MKTSEADLATADFKEGFSVTQISELENLALVAAALCCNSAITIFKNEKFTEQVIFGLELENVIKQYLLNNQLSKSNNILTVEDLKNYTIPSEERKFLDEAGFNSYTVSPILFSNGNCIGTLSIWDVEGKKVSNNQKKSLQILADQIARKIEFDFLQENQKENFYKNIVASYNIGTWEIDVVTTKFSVNYSTAKLLGYSKSDFDDLQMSNFSEIVYSEDFPESVQILKDVYKGNIKKYEHQARLKHKKGYWLWVLIKGEVSKCDSNGNPILITGSIININEQKVKESQLKTIVDIVSCAASRHTLHNDGTEQVEVSEGSYKLLGIPDEEVSKDMSLIFKLIHEDDLMLVQKTIQESAKTLKEWNLEWRIYRADGALRWHKGKGVPTKNKDGSTTWDTVVLDITEHKLKKLELKKLNEQLIHAQKIAKLGYWYWDMRELSFNCTDVIYDIFDLEKKNSKLFVSDIADTLSREELKKITQDRDLAIKENREFKTENKITSKKGIVKWIRQIGNFVLDENGQAVSFEGTLQDITESKLAALALEESILRYSYVTQATSDAIWDLDFKKGKIFWGDNYRKLFGHPFTNNADNDLKYWESQIHPDDRKRVVDSFNACIDEGHIKWNTEYRFKNIKKEYSYVVDRAFIVRDQDGKALRMVGAIQDVTEKVAAFDEIKKSNERFEKIAEATNDAIWEWDIENDLFYEGPGYTKLFGYELTKPYGNLGVWKNYVHPEDYQKASDLAKRMKLDTTVTSYSSEYRFLRKDGTYANVIDRIRILRDEKGIPIRILGALQDVTENKKYEASLEKLNQNLKKQAIELSRYNEELEQFAYVVSHDLQEPLRMISSFLILLEKKYNPIIDDTGKKYIHFAVDGAKRMRQIILDLLDFSRVGRSDEELEIIDLNGLIEGVKTVFRQEIERKNAEIISDNLPTIKNYKILIEQLFQNLIGNALKYQKEGNKPIIKISYEDQDKFYKFIIEDNGIGIDPEYFDKIFVIFQRLHGKSEYKGTGIGLALVKKIIDNLNGQIWVESKLDHGTKFIFTIKKY